MATEVEQLPDNSKEPSLKYLGFLHAAVAKAAVLIASLYEYAKENSGPLKPGVDSVESTVKTVVGPVYHKIEGKPAEVLEIVDRQVDEALSALGQFLPQFLKERSIQAFVLAKQAPDAAKTVMVDVQKRGVYQTVCDYYQKYEPVAEEWTFTAWKAALKLPVVPQVVHIAAPTALYGVDKFNHVLSTLKENRVPFANFVPMLPLDKIERAVHMEPEKL